MYPKSHVCIALSLFILPVLSALESHGDLVQSLSWKGDGSLLATSSKVSVKWTTEIFTQGLLPNQILIYAHTLKSHL